MKVKKIVMSGKDQGNVPDGPRKYQDALYNTLLELSPNLCLEIGTHTGNTARIFQEYFHNKNKDGVLITCDIKKYCDINYENVKFLQVYPHVNNIKSFHNIKNEDLLENSFENINKSVELNINLIKNKLTELNIEQSFDFVFIDGDHQKISFDKDLEIALSLSVKPHYILIDDIWKTGNFHEVYTAYFDEVINKFNHYEFDDWNEVVGMGLIWEKND